MKKKHSRASQYAVLILPCLLLAWVLSQYPAILHKTPETLYPLNVSFTTLFKLAAVFYGIYLLPGWMILLWREGCKKSSWNSQNFLLAFIFGCTAHVLALFLQKYLHLPYLPLSVLSCLAVAYLLLFFLLKWIPVRSLLAGEKYSDEDSYTPGVVWGLLLLTLFLGLEMTLRARGSSLSLVGDGFPHFINLMGTLEDGPMPDGLPFYSTFILNVHPMAFHAMLANLKTLTPGLFYIDLFRYFSVLMVPIFVGCLMGFFSYLAKNRIAGALATLAALFVSGGGLSLQIPIVYFPWYWSIAWCLAAGFLFILLHGIAASKSLCFWSGIVFGGGALMHPFFGFRMGVILLFFLPLEILRRFLEKQAIKPLFSSALLFILGAAIPVGAWLIPLRFKHPFEETYSYQYILDNFTLKAPKGVAYIQNIQQAHFDWKSLWTWSYENAGILPLFAFLPGIYAIYRQRQNPISVLMIAWLMAMGSAVLLGYLPNPYRYFEYFFFGLVALSAYGMGFFLNVLAKPWQTLFVGVLLCLAFFSIRRDFFPKYALALNFYGQTSLSPSDIQSKEAMAQQYLQAKREGTLDKTYGSYTGYLWSRQKKVWDIYLNTQLPHLPKDAKPQ